MKFILLALVITVVGCQKPSTTSSSPTTTTTQPTTIIPPEVTWQSEILKQITANLSSFKKAKDWSDYCTPFANLNWFDQVGVIYAMTLQICKYESNCNPTVIAHNDVGNTDSIGLFQLSYQDNMKWCSMNASLGNLVDPVVNVDCAIPKMAQLISEGGVVASGQSYGTRMGLARYWSVMWPSGHLGDIKTALRSLAICKSM